MRPHRTKNNYLNFAETTAKSTSSGTPVSLSRLTPPDTTCGSQAVRSLGPLRSTCYQACTRGLSTTSSGWDLDPLSQEHGKPRLVGGSALRCFQPFPFPYL